MTEREAAVAIRQRLRPFLLDPAYLMLKNNLKVFRKFQRLLGEKRVRKVLDVGCGFKPWQRFFSGGEVEYIGLDLPGEDSCADVTGSNDNMPFPDNTFDGLVYSEVLEHSLNPGEVIREMRRVAKDGSLVFISSPFVFPEHGIPLDFQRFTRYFYHTCFIQDEIVVVSGSNSSFSTPLISANLVFDSTALRRLWGIKHIFYLANNLLAIVLDEVCRYLVCRTSLKKYYDRFYSFSVGYALVVRIKK